MKTTIVFIMIIVMLGFAQTDNYNLPFVQVESKNESIDVGLCSQMWIDMLTFGRNCSTYFVCLNNRNKRCSPVFSASTDNCVAECDLIKFIDINISIYNYFL